MPVGRKVSYVMAQFDKKDYAVIAAAINSVVSSLQHAYDTGEPLPNEGEVLDEVVVALVQMFATDDEDFLADGTHMDFLQGCGVTL
jgi:hypothetical protein